MEQVSVLASKYEHSWNSATDSQRRSICRRFDLEYTRKEDQDLLVVVAEVMARMVAALNGDKQPKKINFKAAFAGRPYAELVSVQADLTEALKGAEQAEEDALNRIIAKAEQQKKDIAARKAAEALDIAK